MHAEMWTCVPGLDIWEDEGSGQDGSALRCEEVKVRALHCTETHKQHPWQSLKEVKSWFLSLTDMVQCVCIQFFPPTSQTHVAASRLLMGSVSHLPLQCLGALLLAQVSDVLGMALCGMVAGLVPRAKWVTALAAGDTESAWSWHRSLEQSAAEDQAKWVDEVN